MTEVDDDGNDQWQITERNAGKIVKIAYRNKNYKHQKETLENDGYTIIEW